MVSNNLIKVLSIDPAMRNFGMAKFDYDVLTDTFYNIYLQTLHTVGFPNKKNYGQRKNYRIAESYHDFNEIKKLRLGLQASLVGVDVVFAEAYIGGRNYDSLISLVEAFTLLTIIDVPVFFVDQQDAKIAANTNRHTSKVTKKDVMKWAREKFPEANWAKTQDEREHVADALAVAYAGLHGEMFCEWYKSNIENK